MDHLIKRPSGPRVSRRAIAGEDARLPPRHWPLLSCWPVGGLEGVWIACDSRRRVPIRLLPFAAVNQWSVKMAPRTMQGKGGTVC